MSSIRTLALLFLAGCAGLDVDLPSDSEIIESGSAVPFIKIQGERVADAGYPGDWYPTGVTFDARDAGWVITCAGGRVPSLGFEKGPFGVDVGRLFCGGDVH